LTSDPHAAERVERATKRSTLLVATISSFLTPFMASSVNVALPSIGRDFAMDAVALSWVATAYLLAAAMLLVPFGRWADIAGRKKIFAAGMGVYSLASLIIGLAPNGTVMIAARALQGAGATMTFSTSMAVLMSVFGPGERGRVIGITTAAVYLGLSLGPTAGGLLTQYWGWRSIFFLNVPLGLFVLAIILWKLKGEWSATDSGGFDWPGTLLYSLALLAIIYGFSVLPAVSGAVLIAVGLLGLAAFVKWETVARSPLLNLNLFRGNTTFVWSNVAALINYSATFAVTFLLSLYLQYIKGLTPQSAGLVLVAQPIVMAVLSPVAGRLSDHHEPRLVASIGMALTTAGLLLLVFAGNRTPILFIVAALMILGSGFGLFSSPNTNAVMSAVDKRYYGVASAVLGTMRLTGQTLSMGTVMLIFALVIGRVQITPPSYPLFLYSVHIAFVLFTLLCAAGVAASLARGKAHGRPSS
jgi:EmrB/QacA subfamily drug resistance transporter